jgi:riboflavin kinase/FMN adenylyltransferase
MEVVKVFSYQDFQGFQEPSAVSIGVFDGVHLGHRKLLSELIEASNASGFRATVVTFDPHPAFVLRPQHAPALICTLERRLELLEDQGIDAVAIVSFDAARAQESAQDFVKQLLVGKLMAGEIVVGENFHFGHARGGNVELLREMGSKLGFSVHSVGLDQAGDQPVSSTRVRALIASGELLEAARLLARYHELPGVVVHGDGRGSSELSMPTANLEVPKGLAVPKDGVYAGWYVKRPSGEQALKPFPAVISVGSRPTYYPEGGPSLIEAHLLDFNGDLYGQAGSVLFAKRLRGQSPFESVEALREQMHKDALVARETLAHLDPERPR